MIVNADDFGLSEAANRGIVEAFAQGLVSSTTLMANQPRFDEAVELAHARGLEAHVGVHLVLTRSAPLTDEMRRLPRFCDEDGVFRSWIENARAWRVTGRERDAVVGELRAQIERVRGAGFPVTHVDSHHHVHNEWGIGSCVIDSCRDLAVPFVRLARNCGPGISVSHAIYKRAFNGRLRRRGLARTLWFGEATDWLHLRASRADGLTLDDFELMTHPVLDECGQLVDSVTRVPLAALLRPVRGVDTAVSYAGTTRALVP